MIDRRAKIVCTLGPACDTRPAVEDLIRAGMDVARLNFSHGTHEEHVARLMRVRAASEALGKPVAVLQDLSGPKVRTGRFPGGTLEVTLGAEVSLVEDGAEGAAPGEIPVRYRGLAEDLRPGDEVLLDDGRVALRVLRIERERVVCDVTHAGSLRDRVGVHLPSGRVRLPALTDKDKNDLSLGLAHGVDYVALSFVREADDVRLVHDICDAWGRPTPVIAKIETAPALRHLEEIIEAADAVMVARGDLGVELGPERVPIVQREILGLARLHRRPVIVATEMLQSMVTALRPTRAEASDVATAVFEGTDAVMLSAETASGAHPSLAASMMARIIVEAERSRFYEPPSSEAPGAGTSVPEAVARAACDIAREISARVIVAFTESGTTARYASKARPNVPILAFSPNDVTLRRLALLWGVTPRPIEALRDSDEMIDRANGFLLAQGFASPGDRFLALYGAPVGVSGTTNALRVRVVG